MKASIIGVGGRGMGYSNWACENRNKIQIVGVAEPVEEKRNKVQK